MLPSPPNKYALRDLHREIGFYDRKIAHCRALEPFQSDFARAAAVAKLIVRREKLVKSAAGMVSAGVPYEAKDLPASLKEPRAASGAEKKPA